MEYLTYAEYITLGGVLNVTAFIRNISRACSAIDNATFFRLHAMREVPQRVKACCRDLAEFFSACANVSEKGVVSMSQTAGAVSESVTYAAQTAEEMQRTVDNIIFDYLASVTDDNGTPLLYKGAKM